MAAVTVGPGEWSLLGASLGTDGAAGLLAASLFPIFYVGARAVSTMARGYERAADRRRGLTPVQRSTDIAPSAGQPFVWLSIALGALALVSARGAASAMLAAFDGDRLSAADLDPGQAAWLLATVSALSWAGSGRLWHGRWPRVPGGLNVWPVASLTTATVFTATDWPGLIGGFGWVVIVANALSALIAWREWFGTTTTSGGSAVAKPPPAGG